jgi:hypothetical protein
MVNEYKLLTGIDAPSSAKLLAPVHANIAAASHTTKLAPTLRVSATIMPGEELKIYQNYQSMAEVRRKTHKMPDPILEISSVIFTK